MSNNNSSSIRIALLSVALSTMMMGTSFGQAGGGGGGGGGGGAGSEAYNGRVGPVPNNSNRLAPPPRSYPPAHPHPDLERETVETDSSRGCVGELRNSRNNTNQKGCANPRNRVVE